LIGKSADELKTHIVARVRTSNGPMPTFSCGNENFVYESNR
jgi:hypothetical protein